MFVTAAAIMFLFCTADSRTEHLEKKLYGCFTFLVTVTYAALAMFLKFVGGLKGDPAYPERIGAQEMEWLASIVAISLAYGMYYCFNKPTPVEVGEYERAEDLEKNGN